MNKFFLLLLLFVTVGTVAQEIQLTEKVWRLNFINPGVELEMPVSNRSTFSANLGAGYSGSYPELTDTSLSSGFIYVISPFLDL